MRNLIDFLFGHVHWLVFIALEVVSFMLLFSSGGYQSSVYLTTANTFVGKIYEHTNNVVSFLNLHEVNQSLEAENVVLRKRIAELEENLHQNVSDSSDLATLKLPEYEFVGARVVKATLHRPNNLITINKGKDDGVRPEMGVVCSKGVVGVVYIVSDHYSVLLPLLNLSSKTSCRINGSEYFGTMEWRRGAVDEAFVTGIPRHAKVSEGDIIETNGYSDIFPPGIPIGKVCDIESSVDGMSYILKIKLFTDFSNLQNVSIITNYSNSERRGLEEKAESLTTDD